MMYQDILDAIARCDPDEALEPNDPRRVELDDIRGVKVQHNLSKMLAAAASNKLHPFAHIAFGGHRGSGKSTELQRLIGQAEQEGYLVFYIRVIEILDENEVSYSDVLRALTRELDERFRLDPKLRSLSADRVRNVYQWFRDVIRVDEKELETSLQLGLDVGLGGEAKGKVKADAIVAGGEIEMGLGKLLAFIGLQRKSFTKRREEFREALERYPDGLMDNLNLLLDDAQQIAKLSGFSRGILFILDDVDKYPPEVANKVFVRNAGLFSRLNAHLVFTFNIALLYRPIDEPVEGRYRTETLPMTPVYHRNPRSINEATIDRLVEAIYLRVPRELFADAQSVREVARRSGGCPRDLLRILNRALLEADEVIEPRHLNRAAAIVRAEMARPLTKEHYVALVRAHLDGRIDANDMGRSMLLLRQALEYNGERWIDAHPLLQETAEFKEALEQEQNQRAQASLVLKHDDGALG